MFGSKTNQLSPQVEHSNDKSLPSSAQGSVDTTPHQERSDYRMTKSLVRDVLMEMFAVNDSMNELVRETVAEIVSQESMHGSMNSVAEIETIKEKSKKSRGESRGGKKPKSNHTRSESKDKTKTEKTSKKNTKKTKKEGRKNVSSDIPPQISGSIDAGNMSTISRSSCMPSIAKISRASACVDKFFFQDVAMKLLPHRNSICIQDNNGLLSKKFHDANVGLLDQSHRSSSTIASTEDSFSAPSKHNSVGDDDFPAAFAPNDMRCLALVSHNGMKATMKDFVSHYKNVLKKFRLTGTESTMKMLAEVFEGDPDVVFGPSCKSGPLGGDAELVAMMTSGNLGGILFF